MKTLLLDRTTWDLCLDATGNIALASEPYALAQDASSAVRLFNTELWYNTGKGVPYFESVLGQFPPLALVKAKLKEAAMTVPGVVKSEAFITSVKNRAVVGQVQITDSNGTKLEAAFGNVDLRPLGSAGAFGLKPPPPLPPTVGIAPVGGGLGVYGSSSYGDGSVYG